MSEQAHPWWASGGPVDGGISPDEDPVERFRAARRGSSPGSGSGDGPAAAAEPWLEAAATTMSRLARDLARGAHETDAQAPDGSSARTGDDANTGTAPPEGGAPDRDPGPRDPGPRDPGARTEGERAGRGGARRAEDNTGDAAPGGTGAGAGPGDDRVPPHSPDVCGVCPICTGLRVLAESRPELVGHLAEAARQVALAARSLMERPERGDEGGDDPLEHIDLD